MPSRRRQESSPSTSNAAAASTRVSPPAISADEFAQRRERVLRELKSSIGLIFASPDGGGAGLHGTFQPDASFEYLTGLIDEPGAVLLLDPEAEDSAKRVTLLLRPANPEMEAWDGYREPIGGELKSKLRIDTIMRTTALARLLTAIAKKRKKFACLHPFSVYDAPVSADLAVFRKVMERVPGCGVEDKTDLLPTLRSIKSKAELAAMQRAIDATAAGLLALTGALKPKTNERNLQRAFEGACEAWAMEHGCQWNGNAYNPIVGAGLNSTVLHYNANDQTVYDGEVMVVDAGARVDRYCADITRTYPVGGTFTPRQREIYELVLEAQLAAIDAIRPGVRIHEVDAAARKVFKKAGGGGGGGVEDYYIHGIGHHLGLEVHDANPDLPLQTGMVVTIEPGLYIPSERIGVRIEDDILVTPKGSTNLSAGIPKGVREIEALAGEAGARADRAAASRGSRRR
ncbi:MAG: aminopeptidase P N-terminal domain-containing protein [Phycisphaerales bacterium]